jgi:hypothetical protein
MARRVNRKKSVSFVIAVSEFSWIHCLLLFLLLPGTTIGQNSRTEEIVGEIIRKYQNREEQLNPVWVRFHLKHYESANFRKAVTKGLEQQEFHASVNGEFARKGNKTRSWATFEQPKTEWEGDWFTIFTGEISIYPSNQANVYIVTKKQTGNYACSTPFQLGRENHILETLGLLTKGKSVVTSCTETVEESGEKIVVLEWSSLKTNWRDKCWLLSSKDWAIQKYQSFDDKNQLMNDLSVTEFETFRGTVFPKCGIESLYLQGKQERTTEFFVDTFENESTKIPDKLFQYTFPKGSSIWDNDLKVYVRNTELTQTHLDEVVRRAGGDTWSVTWWFFGSAAFCVSCVLLWFYLKRRVRKSWIE